MLGPVICTRAANRALATAIAAIVATVALMGLASPPAHAAGCDTWTNTAGGSWFTNTNWSNNAPPTSEEDACITTEGTYTITMTQTSGTVTVHSLTIGASGTQTLIVGSSCSVNAILTTVTGIVNGANGALVLTNGDSCGNGVTLSGPISNVGALTTEPATGGARQIQGNLTNTGTLAINANTAYNGASASLTNQGAIKVAESKKLTVSNSDSVSNEAGGSIAGSTTGNLFMGSGTTFTEGAGTTSGTKPVIVDDATLHYTGSGAGTIALRGSSSLSGTSAAGQSLSIESSCGEHAVATAASGFTNGGTMTLTNAEGCGNNATVAVSSGTLVNSGKIVTEVAHGGLRQIQGNLTSAGTLAINANTAYNGAAAALINEGPLNIAEGVQLTVSNSGSVTNGTGGKVSITTGSHLFMGSGTSFTQDAGTTSGTDPVIVDDGALIYAAGGGTSQIAVRGSSTLSGNLVKAQSLTIESTCGEHAGATAASGFTNDGTITLTNGDTCGNNATLATTSGTLTNSGRIGVEPGVGGGRFLQGNLTNTGTIAIKIATSYTGSGVLLTNEGVLDMDKSILLKVSGGASVSNLAGGEIIGNGASSGVSMLGGTFTEGGGITTGGGPVTVDDGALKYTGAGKSRIVLLGASTLSGDIGSEQVLLIESTCGENAATTAAASFTNAGLVILTNGDACGNSATLTIGEGTMTNSGQILVEPAVGGARSLQGNLTNTGTLTINANAGDTVVGATLQNNGAINIANGVTFSITGGATVTNGAGGTISSFGSGALVQTKGTFNEAAGATSGPTPVILDDLTLNYTEHGSGTIQLRGSSNLSGTVRSGERLMIASTCSEHAVVTAAGSFNANGTLELTNGDSCGNNATLNLKGGTLTNNGTLVVARLHGGARTIEGNLVNNLIVSLAAGETLHVTGTYTQASAGRLKTFVAGVAEFGVLSVTGTATLAGTLVVRQVEPFKASSPQTYPILSSAALTGTFATETEAQINFTGLYYKPTYSATGMTLVVTQATPVRSPKSGPGGTVVTITGSGYTPGDTITPKFTDSGLKTTVFPTATVNSSGEFSTEITIPAGATLGAGEIVVTSTETGVHVSQSFKVT